MIFNTMDPHLWSMKIYAAAGEAVQADHDALDRAHVVEIKLAADAVPFFVYIEILAFHDRFSFV